MDNLRIVLIIAGICVIAAIYFWDRVQSRKASRRQTVSPAYNENRDSPGIVISAKPRDEDIEAGLAELDGFFIDVEPDLDEEVPGEIFISKDPSIKPVRRPISESLAIPEQADAFASELTAEAKQAVQQEPGAVIMLFVATGEDNYLAGPDIQNAVKALGFEFGEMNIFHHRGTGELAGPQPLFSLVNMYEPGYFDLDQMHSFQTRGLSIFMQLPMRQDPGIVFPYMLEITRRLAKRLDAEVLGPGRKPLDQSSLDSISKLIAGYAR